MRITSITYAEAYDAHGVASEFSGWFRPHAAELLGYRPQLHHFAGHNPDATYQPHKIAKIG